MIASKSQSQATLPEQRSSPLASREKLAIASFIIHYPDQKTIARKMQMRSNSANSSMVSRRCLSNSRAPAFADPRRMER
jgi:hypothetical protein